MKPIRIIHHTEYHYKVPVTFGPHRAMMRPIEGHDTRITGVRVRLEPAATVRWLKDVESNAVAVITFAEASRRLLIHAEVDVELSRDRTIECLIEREARLYPFQYGPEEQVSLVPYRLPSYPYDGPVVNQWLRSLYEPGQVVETLELLTRLNTHIYSTLKYTERQDPGVQLPHVTLALGTGSCRDYAVLMMEAARMWGFGARFVTGYVQMNEGQHGSTHAWTEIYLPGAGWHGFDPTNNTLVGDQHIPVAVSCEQERAAPLVGTWSGPPDAFERMEVSVQVVGIKD